jgi:hypothetical protein
MAFLDYDMEFNDDGTMTIRAAGGRQITLLDGTFAQKFPEELAKVLGNIVERHKPHSHIYLNAQGKMVQQNHSH